MQHDVATASTAPVPPPDDQPKHSHADRLYPSKPTAEIEKMNFSFEAVPRSEPWYITYLRQDEGAEYWFQETDSRQPFLLPYEIENFQEILLKNIQSSAQTSKRGGCRGGGRGGFSSLRTPRKSPRCHASTLAIMSTLLRRRDSLSEPIQPQQQPQQSLDPIKEEHKEDKVSEKSNIDEELTEIARNVDEMLSGGIEDSFEADLPDIAEPLVCSEPCGPPQNLIDMLNNCHDVIANEASSCASSDCSELLGNGDPLNARRRKKKRKNKTGWPGTNKIRKKIHSKNLTQEILRAIKQRGRQQRQELLQTRSPPKMKKGVELIEELQEEGPKENKQLVANCLSKGSPQKTKVKGSSEVVRNNSVEKSPTKLSELTPKKKRKIKINNKDMSPAKRKLEAKQIFTPSEESETTEPSSNSSPKKVLKKSPFLKKSPLKKNKSLSPKTSPKKLLKKKRVSSDTESPYKKNYNKRIRNLSRYRNDTASSSEMTDEQIDKSNSETGQQRRSSMDMQPVVRVTKIEDQVSVASNRRLRSSISPKKSKMHLSKKCVKGSTKKKFGGHSSKKS